MALMSAPICQDTVFIRGFSTRLPVDEIRSVCYCWRQNTRSYELNTTRAVQYFHFLVNAFI